MEKKTWIVASFSGGKDSTAMLLRMIELGEHIDEVIVCDTGLEFPAMYRHIEKVSDKVKQKGVKFTVLKAEHSFEYYLSEYKKRKRTGEVVVGLGWAMPRMRWCTGYLKRDVLNAYYRRLLKKYNVIECVGIAADEEYRLERPNNKLKQKRFPLVEWGWNEAQCLEYCYSLGYDWEGLYKQFRRVSCWCCPLQPLAELKTLKMEYPDLWQRLIEMDKKSPNRFRADYSVEELETKFALEDEFKAQGKSVRGREFFTELRKRIGGLTDGRTQDVCKDHY